METGLQYIPRDESHLINPTLDKCQKCEKKVYFTDKIGPINGAVFHNLCFKCKICDRTLNMGNFNVSYEDRSDKNIYCKDHCPVSKEFDGPPRGIATIAEEGDETSKEKKGDETTKKTVAEDGEALKDDSRPGEESTDVCQRCEKTVTEEDIMGPVNGVVFHKSCCKCKVCGEALTMSDCRVNRLDVSDKNVYCSTHCPRAQDNKPYEDIPRQRFFSEGSNLRYLVEKSLEVCQRCKDRVKAKDKVGPVNGVVFHDFCFKCQKCDIALNMSTYLVNLHDRNDKSLYCSYHCPRIDVADFKPGDEQFSQAPAVKKHFTTRERRQTMPDTALPYRMVNKDAQSPEKEDAETRKRIMGKIKNELRVFQKELEDKQHAEVDCLLQELEKKQDAMEEELERDVKRLSDNVKKFGGDTDNAGGLYNVMPEAGEYDVVKQGSATRQISMRRESHRRQSMQLEQETQDKAAEMEQQHREEMEQFMEEKKAELSVKLDSQLNIVDVTQRGERRDTVAMLDQMVSELDPQNLPPPHPPAGRKKDLYENPSVFQELDKYVMELAHEEQTTIAELVLALMEDSKSDLEDARAIYVWLTMKSHYQTVMKDNSDPKTPDGLLAAIQNGTETYSSVFLKLCRYAGLPCVEIHGHSKSVGYEPGMEIYQDTFKNTWNAVLIEDDWWPIQCNWGARHLVRNKDQKYDTFYQYDEHYFLTDPDEFVQQFWALDSQWQLIEEPISMERFESLPFVRSSFFQYGLTIEQGVEAVLHTDTKGRAQVKFRVPTQYAKTLVFFYQLRFADVDRRDETKFEGDALERFVLHCMSEESAVFTIHVPETGSFMFKIFVRNLADIECISDLDETADRLRLTCACKYKIVCEDLVEMLPPLPECSPGEWGPRKGTLHHGLMPETHLTGTIDAENELEIRFLLSFPLSVVCKLHNNDEEESNLEKYVQLSVDDGKLIVKVNPPQSGQYGLDIYARRQDKQGSSNMTHSCKYLLNFSRDKADDVTQQAASVNGGDTTQPE